jgi:hypothetical protein
VNEDELHRRWVAIVETGLDPKMAPKVRLRRIPIPGRTAAIVVLRVPRSYTTPHMIRETGRFHARHGPENRILDTAEIRSAFGFSERWAERARRFRDERVARLLGGDTPIPLRHPTSVVIHLVPISILAETAHVDLHAIKAKQPHPVYWGSCSSKRFNIDGLLLLGDEHEGAARSYTQFFRDGSIEVLRFAAANDGKLVDLDGLEGVVADALQIYSPVLVDSGASFPCAIMVSLVNAKGLKLPPDEWKEPRGQPVTRDVVLLPDVVLEEPSFRGVSLRQVLDALWQAFGMERSPHFGPNDEWWKASSGRR